jgi:hypothetical protein
VARWTNGDRRRRHGRSPNVLGGTVTRGDVQRVALRRWASKHHPEIAGGSDWRAWAALTFEEMFADLDSAGVGDDARAYLRQRAVRAIAATADCPTEEETTG